MFCLELVEYYNCVLFLEKLKLDMFCFRPQNYHDPVGREKGKAATLGYVGPRAILHYHPILLEGCTRHPTRL